MLSKAVLRISQIARMAPLQQFRLALDHRVRGKVLAQRGSVIRLAPRSKIIAEGGSLTIGQKWHPSDPFRTFVALEGGATLLCGGNFAIHTGSRVFLAPGSKLHLEGEGYANSDLTIECFTSISIGRGTVIGPNVTLRDSDNKSLVPGSPGKVLPITIGRRVWIGSNATILKGVTIGDGAVIAAGSVVVKDVDERTVVAGVPAKPIRRDVNWTDE